MKVRSHPGWGGSRQGPPPIPSAGEKLGHYLYTSLIYIAFFAIPDHSTTFATSLFSAPSLAPVSHTALPCFKFQPLGLYCQPGYIFYGRVAPSSCCLLNTSPWIALGFLTHIAELRLSSSSSSSFPHQKPGLVPGTWTPSVQPVSPHVLMILALSQIQLLLSIPTTVDPAWVLLSLPGTLTLLQLLPPAWLLLPAFSGISKI